MIITNYPASHLIVLAILPLHPTQIALLDSKKSYVRHISHELRTPLNTAFLGLKLLTREMKASEDPKDVERYDTLCDVNMSCAAAVDILNDLLCYEKLDSGILELHKEDVPIMRFLIDSMSMFSAQAKECGVTMTIRTEPVVAAGVTSFSLGKDDLLYVDKFKMDQVIRNLISNALKFTPRGGNVTIEGSFVLEDLAGTQITVDDGGLGFSRLLSDASLYRISSWYGRNNFRLLRGTSRVRPGFCPLLSRTSRQVWLSAQ